MADGVAGVSWLSWSWHPEALAFELLLLGVYLLGVGPLRRRYGWAEEVDRRQVRLFLMGLLVLALSEHSPLHALSERYLFSAHMLQHLLLILVVPPLLMTGTPSWLLRPLLRPAPVRLVARLFTHPVVAFLAMNLMMVLWHFPEYYSLALEDHGAHFLQHAIFVGTSVLAWWPVLSPLPELPRLSYPLQVLYLFLESLPMGFLGAVLTFTTHPLYEVYALAPRVWGMTPLVDQQIGGLLMKVGGGLGFLIPAAVLFFLWFAREQTAKEPLRVEREAGHL
jgi:putative membrane protein